MRDGLSMGCGLSGSDDWPAPAVVDTPAFTFTSGDTPFYRDSDLVDRGCLILDDEMQRLYLRTFAEFFAQTKPGEFEALFS